MARAQVERGVAERGPRLDHAIGEEDLGDLLGAKRSLRADQLDQVFVARDIWRAIAAARFDRAFGAAHQGVHGGSSSAELQAVERRARIQAQGRSRWRMRRLSASGAGVVATCGNSLSSFFFFCQRKCTAMHFSGPACRTQNVCRDSINN